MKTKLFSRTHNSDASFGVVSLTLLIHWCKQNWNCKKLGTDRCIYRCGSYSQPVIKVYPSPSVPTQQNSHNCCTASKDILSFLNRNFTGKPQHAGKSNVNILMSHPCVTIKLFLSYFLGKSVQKDQPISCHYGHQVGNSSATGLNIAFNCGILAYWCVPILKYIDSSSF